MIDKANIQRFWDKVKIETFFDCWEWKACKDRWGYGATTANGVFTKSHRLAWTIVYGPIKKGMFICHKCDNPGCCNPTHLFVGTHKDNMRDMVSKKRFAKGEKNGSSKLQGSQVKKIRRLAQDGVSNNEIALRYKISKHHVIDLVNRVYWKHIE